MLFPNQPKKEHEVDGFAKVGFNSDGSKGVILSFEANHPFVQEDLIEFVDENFESLFCLRDIKQKCDVLTDKMFLITFSYVPYSSFNGEHTEWDLNIIVQDVVLLSKNFKETWLKQISYAYDNVRSEIENLEYVDASDIEKYEFLYGEAFEFVQI